MEFLQFLLNIISIQLWYLPQSQYVRCSLPHPVSFHQVSRTMLYITFMFVVAYAGTKIFISSHDVPPLFPYLLKEPCHVFCGVGLDPLGLQL